MNKMYQNLQDIKLNNLKLKEVNIIKQDIYSIKL